MTQTNRILTKLATVTLIILIPVVLMGITLRFMVFIVLESLNLAMKKLLDFLKIEL